MTLSRTLLAFAPFAVLAAAATAAAGPPCGGGGGYHARDYGARDYRARDYRPSRLFVPRPRPVVHCPEPEPYRPPVICEPVVPEPICPPVICEPVIPEPVCEPVVCEPVVCEPIIDTCHIVYEHGGWETCRVEPRACFIDPGSRICVNRWIDYRGERVQEYGWRWTSHGVPHASLTRYRRDDVAPPPVVDLPVFDQHAGRTAGFRGDDRRPDPRRGADDWRTDDWRTGADRFGTDRFDADRFDADRFDALPGPGLPPIPDAALLGLSR